MIWANLGEAQRGAKKYPDAIESYQKAIALKPTNGPYHSALADALAKSGQTDKAVAEWATAVQNDPTNAGTYYFNEGAVLTNTGKVDEAIAAFDKALQADPTRADAYYWKGVDLMGKATVKGDKMVAPPGTAEAFNKYLQLAPNGKYADPAKQMLASIGAPVETSYGKSQDAAQEEAVSGGLCCCKGGCVPPFAFGRSPAPDRKHGDLLACWRLLPLPSFKRCGGCHALKSRTCQTAWWQPLPFISMCR